MKSISQNTIALLILTCVGGVLLLKIAVPLLFFAIPVRFESTWGYESTSGRYKQIQIHAAGSGARDSDVIEDSNVTLTLLTLGGERKTLQMAYKGDAIDFANRYCSPEKLEAWMRSQGVERVDERVQAECRELSSEILNAAAGYSGPSRTLTILRPIL